MHLTRRDLMVAGLAGGICGPTSVAWPAESPARGGMLIVGQDPEPLALASAGSIDAGAAVVSVKIFDRLFNINLDGKLVPQLALSGRISDDGLAVTLNLRPGVTWHDGTALTSADVAYSITEVWRRYIARSQMAFVNLVGVDTPSPLVAVIRFSQPAPYIFSTLADGTSQVVPRHLYEGKDVLGNPYNLAPVGSGPFQFESWERGGYLVLKRNPNYWDAPKPYADKLVFRFVASGAAMVTALETGSIHYTSVGVPLSDIERLKKNPALWVRELGPNYSANFSGFAFNLNRLVLRDARVRQAFAHAIDKSFIVKNIWLGHGTVADSPIPPGTEFHAQGLPNYVLDLKKAEALLDEAGLPRKAGGVRLTLYNEVMPPLTVTTLSAQFIRASLAKIGVKLQLRSEGLGAYLKRIFTSRDWDTETYTTGSDFDPALGIQRFYWSKSIQPGVAFSNPTHYSTPEVDKLLEAAQTELDREKRRQFYFGVQKIVQHDLPLIPILFPSTTIIGSRQLTYPLNTRTDNFANASLASA